MVSFSSEQRDRSIRQMVEERPFTEVVYKNRQNKRDRSLRQTGVGSSLSPQQQRVRHNTPPQANRYSPIQSSPEEDDDSSESKGDDGQTNDAARTLTNLGQGASKGKGKGKGRGTGHQGTGEFEGFVAASTLINMGEHNTGRGNNKCHDNKGANEGRTSPGQGK